MLFIRLYSRKKSIVHVSDQLMQLMTLFAGERLLGRDQHEQHGELMPQDAAYQQPWCNSSRH